MLEDQLKIGDYIHYEGNWDEWMIVGFLGIGLYSIECTSPGNGYDVGYVDNVRLYHYNGEKAFDFIVGRLPENISKFKDEVNKINTKLDDMLEGGFVSELPEGIDLKVNSIERVEDDKGVRFSVTINLREYEPVITSTVKIPNDGMDKA